MWLACQLQGQKVKGQRSRSPDPLMLTHIVLHIFRMPRPTNFKLGTRIEDDDPHQSQAPWPPRSMVKVARSRDPPEPSWPNAVPGRRGHTVTAEVRRTRRPPPHFLFVCRRQRGRNETFTPDRQWLWDYATKLLQWQHHAMRRGAPRKKCFLISFTFWFQCVPTWQKACRSSFGASDWLLRYWSCTNAFL